MPVIVVTVIGMRLAAGCGQWLVGKWLGDVRLGDWQSAGLLGAGLCDIDQTPIGTFGVGSHPGIGMAIARQGCFIATTGAATAAPATATAFRTMLI